MGISMLNYAMPCSLITFGCGIQALGPDKILPASFANDFCFVHLDFAVFGFISNTKVEQVPSLVSLSGVSIVINWMKTKHESTRRKFLILTENCSCDLVHRVTSSDSSIQ